MRKTVFIFISLLFTGGLMIYTAQANLDLLTQTYPNPQFVGFGMLALEGGILYWLAVYLIHWTGHHKGIALVMMGVDALFSLIGFFVEISHYNASNIFIGQLPGVVVLVGLDVAINVGVGWIVHLLPDNRTIVKEDFRPFVETTGQIAHKVLDSLPSPKRPIKNLEKKVLDAQDGD